MPLEYYNIQYLFNISRASRGQYRSEGFARAAYFVPGCDGAGVWQDSEILPAPSLLENVHPNTIDPAELIRARGPKTKRKGNNRD